MAVKRSGEILVEQAEEVAVRSSLNSQAGRDVDAAVEVGVKRLAECHTQLGIRVEVELDVNVRTEC